MLFIMLLDIRAVNAACTSGFNAWECWDECRYFAPTAGDEQMADGVNEG